MSAKTAGKRTKAKQNGQSQDNVTIPLTPLARYAMLRWLPQTVDLTIGSVLQVRQLRAALRIDADEMKDRHLVLNQDGMILQRHPAVDKGFQLPTYETGIALGRDLWEMLYAGAVLRLTGKPSTFPNTDADLDAFVLLCTRCGFEVDVKLD